MADKSNSRSKARADRAKEKKMEVRETTDVNRAKEMLRTKYQALLSHQSEIHQLRGAMLGIIEAFDLTADDANVLLGVEYFQEFEPGSTPEEMMQQVQAAQGGGGDAEFQGTPEPEPVEGDEVTVG